MNYELAKEAQEIAEKMSLKNHNTTAFAELYLPDAYKQISEKLKDEEKK